MNLIIVFPYPNTNVDREHLLKFRFFPSEAYFFPMVVFSLYDPVNISVLQLF